MCLDSFTGWSLWSAYGSCSMPCGTESMQTRTRDCLDILGNPGHAGGCPGEDSQGATCTGLPVCPGKLYFFHHVFETFMFIFIFLIECPADSPFAFDTGLKCCRYHLARSACGGGTLTSSNGTSCCIRDDYVACPSATLPCANEATSDSV